MERIPNSFQNRPPSLHYKLIAKNKLANVFGMNQSMAFAA